MNFSHFTSIYEVFIGLLSAFVGFESLQKFLLDRYLNFYSSIFEEREKLNKEVAYLEKSTLDYSTIFIKQLQDEPALKEYLKRFYEINKEIEDVKKRINFLNKDENFVKDNDEEQLFSKRIVLSLSAFAIFFYFSLLLIAGFCSCKYWESSDCMIFVFYWELLILTFYVYYLKILTCTNNICQNRRKHLNENLGFIFIFQRFILILVLNIVIYFLINFFELYYIDIYYPLFIIFGSFLVILLPFFSLYYRFTFYLKGKANRITHQISLHKQSLNQLRLKLKI